MQLPYSTARAYWAVVVLAKVFFPGNYLGLYTTFFSCNIGDINDIRGECFVLYKAVGN